MISPVAGSAAEAASSAGWVAHRRLAFDCPFMPGRGLDAGFMNGAFVFNPVLGRTISYSTFGAGAAILVGGYPVFTLTVYDTNNDSTTSGFNVLFNNGAVIYPTVSLPTTFFGMPGHQSVWGAYSSGSYTILTPQSLNLIPECPSGGLLPPTLVRLPRRRWSTVPGGSPTCSTRRYG